MGDTLIDVSAKVRGRPSNRRWRLAAVLLGGALVIAGCTLLNPLSDYDRGSPKSGDAASDAIQEFAPDVVEAGCIHSRWPAPTNRDDVGTSATYVMAFSALDFGGSEKGQLIDGFDLDNVCTCPEKASCKPLFASEAGQCDFAGGFDNAAGRLVVQAAVGNPTISQTAVNSRMQAGEDGLLLQIAKYNGTPNDSQVDVSIFRSSHGTQVVRDDAGKRPPLAHDGSDKWLIDDTSVRGAPYIPMFVTSSAYVVDSKLVALGDFPLGLGTLVIDLEGTVVVGTLSKAPGGFRIDNGVIGGRWATRKLLTGLQTIREPGNFDSHLCLDSGIYRDIKKQICLAADIRTKAMSDNMGGDCDALSVALHFTSEPATLGTIEVIEVDLPCGATYVDDCVLK